MNNSRVSVSASLHLRLPHDSFIKLLQILLHKQIYTVSSRSLVGRCKGEILGHSNF